MTIQDFPPVQLPLADCSTHGQGGANAACLRGVLLATEPHAYHLSRRSSFFPGGPGLAPSRKSRIEVETGNTVIWPFELFDQAEIAKWGAGAPRLIMRDCRDALVACDLVVALLAGPQVDDGTAWEIGYAHAKGMPVIGIRTDFRFGAAH